MKCTADIVVNSRGSIKLLTDFGVTFCSFILLPFEVDYKHFNSRGKLHKPESYKSDVLSPDRYRVIK